MHNELYLQAMHPFNCRNKLIHIIIKSRLNNFRGSHLCPEILSNSFLFDSIEFLS